MSLQFAIKICGITCVDDALMVVAAGADAIGLNFYSKSSRAIGLDAAQAVAEAVGDRACRVGVFVDASPETIQDYSKRVPLDAIQLHGDEPAGFRDKCPVHLPVIRALRIGSEGFAPFSRHIHPWKTLTGVLSPTAVLVDARTESAYGGTGVVADWQLLVDYATHLEGIPLILAGGLTPENVAEAIAKVRPTAVDTASGVESAPGKKDPQQVVRFVAAAQRAFATAG